MNLRERKKRLSALLKRYAGARMLVIGDAMVDRYIWGDVARISPEAPVPIVRVTREELRLGGAANVASNLRALGASVSLCALVGDDEPGRELRARLTGVAVDDCCLFTAAGRRTVVKERVIAQHQQVVRVDWDDDRPPAPRDRRQMIDFLAAAMPATDGVVVSDYAKGAIGKELLDALRRLAASRRVPVVVDPKIRNAHHYRGFASMTPNHHEAGEMLGVRLPNTNEAIHPAGRRLRKKLRLDTLVITRGEEGMTLFFEDESVVDLPTVAREVYDVTGAGDTVIAALGCGLAVGGSLLDAARIANYAAGIVIAEVGAASAPAAKIAEAIREAKTVK
jgi:D-beta-D-heptose 7-phosphate kinase/D-beta-D-heptose 1-phosphate adenosyltransferase